MPTFKSTIFRSLALTVLLPLALHAQPATVILVRHAEKASQTESDRVLSEAGMQRAKDPATAFADAGYSKADPGDPACTNTMK